jgi:hypothetical protein
MKTILLDTLKRIVCYLDGHDWEPLRGVIHPGGKDMLQVCAFCGRGNREGANARQMRRLCSELKERGKRNRKQFEKMFGKKTIYD